MCTAVSFKHNNHFFGRNLDIEFSYGEKVIITPRKYPFKFNNSEKYQSHNAIIGIGIAKNDTPLYFDATNEKGLSMAALNFPVYCRYNDCSNNATNIASFEVIPYILSECSNTTEAKKLLTGVNITNASFSRDLPPTSLHWLISDGKSSATIEQTESGLKIYDNPTGVLTNSPTFDIQLFSLNNFMALSCKQAENIFSDKLNFLKYSNGMGAIGLPGDFSSTSRFVRACFLKFNSACGSAYEDALNQFFHILESVKQIEGCTLLENGKYEKTIYSSCCNTDKGIYYYKTYNNSQITAVSMNNENLDSETLILFPLLTEASIKNVN